MRKFVATFAGIAGTVAVPAAAQAQDLLGGILKALTRAPASGASVARSTFSPPIVTPSSEQGAQMKAAVVRAEVTPNARVAMTEAGVLLDQTIATISCATDAKAFHTLNKYRVKPRNYATPDHSLWFTAMGGMKYHDRLTCVTLNRIAKVEMPALNAMVLTLNFVSDSSGEAATKTVTFRKLGGQWMLDTLGNFELSG